MNTTSKIVIVIAAIVMFVIAAFAANYYLSEAGQGKPSIAIALLAPAAKNGAQNTLSLKITAYGSSVSGVTIHLSSDAFNQASTSSFDIAANSTVNVPCKVNLANVASGNHEVAISYEYSGSNGLISSSPQSIYVIPNTEITGEHWPRQWYNVGGFGEKSTITQNDNTTFYFSVKNDDSWTCSGLTATATLPAGTIGLTVTPQTVDLGKFGPTGTNGEFTFGFASHNAPTGTYTFTVHVFSGQYEAFAKTFTLWVTS